jgi:hypothetical protein
MPKWLVRACRETEWNKAFDFSKDTSFLTNCMKETKGTYTTSTYLLAAAACIVSQSLCILNWHYYLCIGI